MAGDGRDADAGVAPANAGAAPANAAAAAPEAGGAALDAGGAPADAAAAATDAASARVPPDGLDAVARGERPPPSAPTHEGAARNRFCADHVRVSVRAGEAAGWSGEACVVCRAAANLTCDALAAGATPEQLRGELERALGGEAAGPFAPLAGVSELPSRHACARLPLEAAARAFGTAPPVSAHPAGAPGAPIARSAASDAWAAVSAFRARGLDVAVATLVEVVGSSPCPLGSHLVVADNGEFWGAVSGGCVEGAVVQAGLELLAGDRRPVLRSFQIANSQAGSVGLPCGGRVRVHVAPAPGDRALRRYRRGAGLARVVDLAAGTERLAPPDELPGRPVRPELRGDTFVQPLLAPPRLVLVGGSRIAQVLAELARPLGFAVAVVEPRPGFAGPNRFAVPVHEDLAALPPLDADTAVVMLTHDERIDDAALRIALASPALYVGALGSRKTQRARLQRLAAAGLPPEQLARLRGPAGLAIGAVGAEEIALSILAEVVQTRRHAAPAGVGSVVLAAGSSRRAGPANKLLQPIEGAPMIRRVVQTVLAAGVGPCVVVLGHEAEAVRGALDDLPVQFVLNPEHARGMGTSIAAGVEAIAAHGVGSALVVLGDMPWFGPDVLRRLVAAHTPATRHLVVAPVAGEGRGARRGNPVLWPARYFDALRALRGDSGGKAILARAPGALLEVRVDDPGVLHDVDGILAVDEVG